MDVVTNAYIRDWLGQYGPASCGDFNRAHGIKGVAGHRIGQRMAGMFKDGVLSRIGQGGPGSPFVYGKAREAMDRIEAAARAAQGRREAAARRRTPQAVAAARKARRERQRSYEAKRPKSMPRLVSVVAAASAIEKRTPVLVERIETVSEWMQRTGQQPQRLNPWDVSEHNRLKGRYAS